MDAHKDPDVAPMPTTSDGAAAIDHPSSEGGRWRRPRPLVALVLGVLVVPIAMAAALTSMATATVDPSDARVVSVETLEREYGVRFDLVGVTASGGLIDVRFTVLDAEKAKALFHDAESGPALYVERDGAVLRTRKGMSHRLSLLAGGRYFLLFSNAGGVIQAGTPVSVLIDDLRLEPLTAQS